jgi:hypothetical protein
MTRIQNSKRSSSLQDPLLGCVHQLKIRNTKHEIRDVTKNYRTQIFTDTSFPVRLAAEEAMQRSNVCECNQLFFFAEGDGVNWF